TRELLLKKQNLSMSVPRPPVLGRRTLYPTQFNATYDSASNAYQFVFSGFTLTDK
ncbi:cytochrome C, partial [Acinetobacter pittii]|nr:cytochrome C [Acinetobacter pittii]